MAELIRSPRESAIERTFTKKVAQAGGKAIKFVSPGLRGVMDRLVLKPDGVAVFVELKKKGEIPEPLQLKRRAEFEALGFRVYVIDSLTAIEKFIDVEFPAKPCDCANEECFDDCTPDNTYCCLSCWLVKNCPYACDGAKDRIK